METEETGSLEEWKQKRQGGIETERTGLKGWKQNRQEA